MVGYKKGEFPIGTIMAYNKDYNNTPSLSGSWAECNGQIISDIDSVYDGQTLPDLNGENRFLRGSSTSGTTGGSSTHKHSLSSNTDYKGAENSHFADRANVVSYTNSASTLVPYYNIIWVIRIK